MSIWSFGGITLDTFGKITLIDGYLDTSERRGENQLLPFRHGRRFVEKYYEERKLLFEIALQAASAQALESTLDSLSKLLAVRTQQTLSHTREDGTIRTVSATVDSPLDPVRYGSRVAIYHVEFTLAFPFFRLSTEISNNETTINASPKAMVVTNPGTVEERDATIVYTGPLLNTVITNSTNGCVLTYTGTIASPRVVTLSVSSDGEYVATDDLGANKIGNFSHSPASAMMVFNPDTNNLSITDGTATTGKVRVRFNAPFANG